MTFQGRPPKADLQRPPKADLQRPPKADLQRPTSRKQTC